MRQLTISGTAAILAMSLAACSSSGKPLANPTPPATPTTATPTATAPATGTTSSKPVTTLDPCQLTTQQEASQLTGRSYGPGKEGGVTGGPKSCIYGARTKNVFTVIVVQGSTTQQAQTMRNAMLAQLKASAANVSLPVTKVPGVGDDAQAIYGNIAVGNGVTLFASGIYVLKGTISFALVDETGNGGAPSTAALTAQAQTVLGRLP